MLATLLLLGAAALPLGAWPEHVGPAATVVDDVEFYLLDPEDDYAIVAVQALETPLAKAEPAAVKRLATLATRLGADAVLLLGELPEARIPDDVEAPLETTGRYSVAVFLTFVDAGDGEHRAVPGSARRGPGTGRGQPATHPRR